MGTFADRPQGAVCCHPWVVTFGAGFASLHNLMASQICPVLGNGTVSAGLCRLNLLYILWISAMFVCSAYPVGPSMSSNPFYLNCQLYEKSDYCLVLLNSCLAKVGRSEELALLKPPFLEMPFNKRSFRNGVGSGIKKTSFRRAKS
ncbi:neuropeptide S [Lagopus muta]|uniref:neuropeptide S n=1 Tax=Lagopus muta TaxID=64668 RepID=UPI0020A01D67|nr:neuropeptide S [Lagopus muta]